MIRGSLLVQVKRFMRLLVFAELAALPAALEAERWWIPLLAAAVPIAEVLYRSFVPATPDVATSPEAASDEAIPVLG